MFSLTSSFVRSKKSSYHPQQLDGTPALNLASFVTTFMDPAAEKLMMENLNKNAIDAVSDRIIWYTEISKPPAYGWIPVRFQLM
jgi:hypothetical protein